MSTNPTSVDFSRIGEIAENIDKGLNTLSEKYSILLDILKGSGGSSSSTANLVEPSSVLEGLNNYFSSLSLLETYSLVHMSSMVLIVLCLFSIVSIFYSEVIITKLRLDERWCSKISKFTYTTKKIPAFLFNY